jgi:hypothetical protein
MSLGKDGRMYPNRKGTASPSWLGGRQASGNGAIQVVDHDNPRADSRGRVYEHVLVAERALGKQLPQQAVVHHRNGDRSDNVPDNLVICEDQAYHLLLHRRLRAYRACGHADWLKCVYCKKWDTPGNLYVRFQKYENSNRGPNARHRACHSRAVNG